MKESQENHNLDKTSKIKNCTIIGYESGTEISEGENIVIIGDNIKSLDKKQEGVLFVGDKIAIGFYLFGKRLNLLDILIEFKSLFSDKIRNCFFTGYNAGIDIKDGENIVIIGDNIKSLDKSKNKDALFIGDRIAIGDYLFGKKLNLKDIILNQNKSK